MTRCVDEVQEVVLVLVFVEHRTCLRLHSDTTLSFDIQLVENLLVRAGLDGAGQLEQAIAESALPMINMGDNTEIPVPLDGYCGDALLYFSGRCCSQ